MREFACMKKRQESILVKLGKLEGRDEEVFKFRDCEKKAIAGLGDNN